MKKLIYLALCLTTITNAQTSIGLSAGVQSWQDECSTSELLGEGSVQFYQGFNKYLGMRLTANAGYLKNVNIPYDTNYIIGNFDFIINAGPVLGFKDKYYQFQPFFGAGYGRVENQNLFNVHAGLLQKVKLIDRLWLSLELSRRGYLDANPLGNHQGNLRGVSAIQDIALVGLIFDFVKRKDKPQQKIIERVIEKRTELLPQVVYNDCNTCEKEYKYVVYFDEGKPKENEDCSSLYSDKNIDQLRQAIDKIKYLSASEEEYVIEYHLWSCHNHGSKESNKKLRLRRGKCTASEVGKSGIMIDHGTEVKYSNIAHQRAVEVIIKLK